MWTRVAFALSLTACGPKTAPEPAPEPVSEPAAAVAPTILLDGVRTTVRWDDGDTFKVVTDDGSKSARARLAGFNTLESYGPVHRWGDWTAQELFALSKAGGELAEGQVWACTTLPGGGGYGRDKVDCAGLRTALLEAGLAHLFAFDGTPLAADLEVQTAAMGAGAGMWAKGAPSVVVTSLHSLDEKPDQTETYNRVADTATGVARKVLHGETYAPCQEVCVDDACMVYVPYKQRYGDSRAACLRE